MTKRLAVTLPDDPFKGRPIKRAKTFWLGAQCWQYDRKTSRPRPRTTFLDLPLELREQIYDDALEDVVTTLKHPYDDLPKHDRFEPYLTLRLLNRQVSDEVKSIWRKKYESRLVFYFDNPPELWDLWQEVADHPRLCNASFCLRAINDDEDEMSRQDGGNRIREDTELLIEDQQGVMPTWVYAPGMYGHKGRDATTLSVDGAGFTVKEGRHTNCVCPPLDCIHYREVIYPAIPNSLRIRGYMWKAAFDDENNPGQTKTARIGSLVLEGKMNDIEWGQYDLRIGRSRLKRHRLEERFGPLPTWQDPYDSYASDEEASDSDGSRGGSSDDGSSHYDSDLDESQSESDNDRSETDPSSEDDDC